MQTSKDSHWAGICPVNLTLRNAPSNFMAISPNAGLQKCKLLAWFTLTLEPSPTSHIHLSFLLTMTIWPTTSDHPRICNTLCLSMRSINLFLVSIAPYVPGVINTGVSWGLAFLLVQQDTHSWAFSCASYPQRGQQQLQRGILWGHFILWLFCPATNKKWQPDPSICWPDLF